MYYTVYKTTNIVNGRYYIGAHETENINDAYLGSGLLLQKAVNKYGRDTFIKEVLFVFLTSKEMYEKETEIVILKSEDSKSYNITEGGCGGKVWGEKHPMYGKKHTEETKLKISLAQIGRKHTEETKRKISEAHKGKILSEETKVKMSLAKRGKHIGENNPMYGKKHTEETRIKISLANIGRASFNKGKKLIEGKYI